MANDIPHDGASLEMEVDPEFKPLPLSDRPFDPAAYHPEIHVLSPDIIRQFRGFARGVPEDLLLSEPESHLSHGASEGIHAPSEDTGPPPQGSDTWSSLTTFAT